MITATKFPFEDMLVKYKADVKADTKVFSGKINIPSCSNVEKREHADGSFSVIVYDKVYPELAIDIRHDENWQTMPYGYHVITPKIKDRKVLLHVIIKKPSSHKFIVIINSRKFTDVLKFNNYECVNEALRDLFYEKPKKDNKRC